MKRIGMAILTFALCAVGTGAQQSQQTPPKSTPPAQPSKAPASGQSSASKPPAAQTPAPESGLKTEKEKTSYAVGMEMGKGIKAQGIDVDQAVLMQGLKDALSDAKPQMSDLEVRQVIVALQQQIRQKQMEAQKAAAAENKAKGDAYLADNAKKPGVVALPDGLQYKVISAGQGKKPAESDTVLCNYKGRFIDGTEFDSSERAGRPVPFEVKNVIPGFKEVLQMMPVGSKWQVVIPANLAYGENGAANVIGPNSTLVFEIELVSIQDAASAPASGAPAPDAPPAK